MGLLSSPKMHQIQNFPGSTPASTGGAHCAPPYVLDGGTGLFSSPKMHQIQTFSGLLGGAHTPQIFWLVGTRLDAPSPNKKPSHAFHPSGLSLSVLRTHILFHGATYDRILSTKNVCNRVNCAQSFKKRQHSLHTLK